MKFQRRFFTILIFIFLAVGWTFAIDRKSDEKKAALPTSGEHLIYEGDFTKSLLRGVNIAELRFSTEGFDQRNGGLLKLKVEAVSTGLVPKLFGIKFHQLVESHVEPTSLALVRSTRLDEQGNRKRTSETVVDCENGKLTWTERDPNNPERQAKVLSSTLVGTVQDLGSAVYYLRAQKLDPGRTFDLFVSDSGRVYRVPIRVLDRKRMKTILGNLETVRVEPQIFGEGGLVDGKGSVTFWFTDDPLHIPVKAHIESEMGSLDIKLKRISRS